MAIGAIALVIVILGLVVYIAYLKQGGPTGSSATAQAHGQAEPAKEESRDLSQAVLNELTDDLGKKIYSRTYAKIPFGIYGTTNLERYEYHPIKKMHVLDLNINWSGQISGKDYWIEARVYVSDPYIENGGKSGDIHYEVRQKSDTVRKLEKTIGGLAIAIGVLEKLSERR